MKERRKMKKGRKEEGKYRVFRNIGKFHMQRLYWRYYDRRGFPGCTYGKELTWECTRCERCNVRDTSLIPRSERSLRERHGNSLQYSCFENPMDRGAWWATVHGVTELDMTEAT